MKTCCKNEEDYQNWKQPQETKTGSKNEEEHQIMKATRKYEDGPPKNNDKSQVLQTRSISGWVGLGWV